jgi:hypothetical protein
MIKIHAPPHYNTFTKTARTNGQNLHAPTNHAANTQTGKDTPYCNTARDAPLPNYKLTLPPR